MCLLFSDKFKMFFGIWNFSHMHSFIILITQYYMKDSIDISNEYISSQERVIIVYR